ACLARDGHQLVGVDVDRTKLDLIRARKSPILEEGIQELMRDVVDSGRVTVTHDAARAVLDTDVAFKAKPGFHTLVVRSTVLPGTLEEKIAPLLEKVSGKQAGVDFGLAFQP